MTSPSSSLSTPEGSLQVGSLHREPHESLWKVGRVGGCISSALAIHNSKAVYTFRRQQKSPAHDLRHDLRGLATTHLNPSRLAILAHVSAWWPSHLSFKPTEPMQPSPLIHIAFPARPVHFHLDQISNIGATSSSMATAIHPLDRAEGNLPNKTKPCAADLAPQEGRLVHF